MTRPFDLLGLGQISLDRVGVVERLPRRGAKARLEAEHLLPGGQVATALLAAARLGLRCAFAGVVGDDAAGAIALAPLREAGVDTSRVRREGATREAWVIVERALGERTILERPGAVLPAGWLTAADVASARMLLLDLEHPEASRQAAEHARSAGVPVVLDADRVTQASRALVQEVDFPIVAQGFAEEFSSDASLEERLRALGGPAARAVVVTLGERGSVALLDGRVLETPAPRVDVVDTTGAGDVFRGAFAWALLRGCDVPRALEHANRAGALSCRGLGAQGALPVAAEIEASGADRRSGGAVGRSRW